MGGQRCLAYAVAILRIVNLVLLDEAHHEIQVMRCDQHIRRYRLIIIVIWHLNESSFRSFSNFTATGFATLSLNVVSSDRLKVFLPASRDRALNEIL